jgi:hypothetical protein
MARLLDNGKQTFFDANGEPLGGGSVYMYVPSTTTFKDTWQDPDETILNTNPIVLDAAGRAIIYGSGTYRQIVKDADANTIWDQLTSSFADLDSAAGGVLWGGTSTGTPNAQVIDTATFSDITGLIIVFIAGFTNTGPMTLVVEAEPARDVLKITDVGPVQMTGDEVIAGNMVVAVYDPGANAYQMVDPIPTALIVNSVKTKILFLTGVITPAALSAQTDDWNPTDLATASRIRVSSTLAVTITGIAAQGDGRLLLIDNIGSYAITLDGDNGSSAAANRFAGADDSIGVNESVLLVYDGTSNRWRVYNLGGAVDESARMAQFYKLHIRNGADVDHEMRVTASGLVVASGSKTKVLKNIDVTADIEASGANGLDTGTSAVSTAYFIWVIYNPTTSVAAGLFSLSATAPTMPAGYTYKKRVGWNTLDAGSNFLPVIQRGEEAHYIVDATHDLPLIASGAEGSSGDPGTWGTHSVVGLLPSTALYVGVTVVAGDDDSARVAPNNQYYIGSGGALNIPPLGSFNGAQTSGWLLLESNDVFYYSNNANGRAVCFGWRDNL